MGRPFPMTRPLRWAPTNLNPPKIGESYLVAYRVECIDRWLYAVVDVTEDGLVFDGRLVELTAWHDLDWSCPTSELSPTLEEGE